MAVRVSSPHFVGRSAELDQIADAITRASAGEGRFLLVGGEAGVGKTRLLDEAAGRVRQAGGLTAVGRCIDLAGGSAPLVPVAQLLHELRSAVVSSVTDGSGSLERLDALDEIAAAPSAGEPVGIASDWRQVRFFEAWLDLLEAVGASRPLLVVVEDIHWADRSTLDWLAYVARGRAQAHFTVVASVRTDELHRRHPIQPFLAELQRLPNVRRLDITRFDRLEVAQQIAAIAGAPADPELVDSIFGRSNGNAFFTEELVAASVGDGPLPRGLRDVILERVTELGGATEELLRTASVAGDRFSSVTLATVMTTTVAETENRLRTALDRHVVIPIEGAGGDAFGFRHALVREAVYTDLLPGERTRLHGRFAAAIEEEPDQGASRSAELAYHWLAAYDLPRAFDASLAAASAAESVHAYADAQPHYDRAIDLWDRVPDAAERSGLDRAGLLERAANAASITDLDRAMALVTTALESAPVDADRARIALLKERFGRYAWLMGDGLTAIDACREAAELVPAEPPTRDRARVLASLGQILMLTVDMEAAEPIATEAVRIARSVGARELETHAITTLGLCVAYRGDLDGGLTLLHEALDIARAIDSIADVDRANANIVDVLANSGFFREASDVAIAASGFADEHGLARALGAWQLAEGALGLYRLGDWSRARALLERASAQRLTGAPLIATEQWLALLDVGQGRFEDARVRIDHVRPLLARTVEPQMFTPLTEAIVELALWENRPRDAHAAMIETLARLPLDRASYISRLGPVLALAIRTEADIAAIAHARGDSIALREGSDAAQADLDAMRHLRDQAHAGRPNFISQADAWCLLCEAERTRLSGDADPAAWSTAAAAFEAIPMDYPRAYALWRAGEANLATGRKRSEATESLREASVLAIRLQADPLLAEVRALASRAHIDLEIERPAERDAPQPSDTLGLTRRELEVLRLIAAGDSNRQIAERLFITEGTAGTHVSNIIGKLGVRGRTEAAAIAHRLSLVE